MTQSQGNCCLRAPNICIKEFDFQKKKKQVSSNQHFCFSIVWVACLPVECLFPEMIAGTAIIVCQITISIYKDD